MTSDSGPRPLYLLADSQLLFWKHGRELFLYSILQASGSSRPNVAYLGASNGDSSDAHAIMTVAMEQVEVGDLCRFRSAPTEEDQKFVDTAVVLILAGGDPVAGWNVFKQT